MNRLMLKQYTKLVEFLSLTLGPCYEIVLLDIRGREISMAALVNGHISGRDLSSPPTALALKALEDNAAGQDYHTNYNGLSADGKPLRSSTYYIKDDGGRLVGMLCLNFDDTAFRNLSSKLFQLIHPDNYVENNIVISSDVLSSLADIPETERFGDSVTWAADDTIEEILGEEGVPVDRLTQEEKIRIVARLKEKGIFRLKGSVGRVSQALGSSPASIYRYLGRLRQEEQDL